MTEAADHKPTTLARGSAIMFLALVISGGLSVLISIAIARIVGVVDFGVYSIVVGVQAMFSLAAGLGLGTAIAKFVSEYRMRNPAMMGRYIKTALVLAMISSGISIVVYVSLSHVIGVILYDEHAIMGLIPFSALVVLSTAFHSMAVGMMQGSRRMSMLAGFQVSVPALNLALIFPLVTLLGVKGAFISYFIAQGSIFLTGLYLVEKRVVNFVAAEIRVRNDEVLRKLLGFAIPGVIAGVLVGPVYWIGSTELVLTTGFEAMGLFAVALVFFNALAMVQQAIVIPLMPRVSELSVGNVEQIGKTVSKALRYVAMLAFPLFFGIALFSEQIVTFLYGSSYSQASEAMYILITAGYFSASAAILGGMITGLGRMWLALGLNLVWASAFIGLTFVLVPSMGLVGLGTAYAFSYAIHLVVVFSAVRRLLKHDMTPALVPVACSSVLFLAGFLTLEYLSEAKILVAGAMLVLGILMVLYIGRNDLEDLKKYARSILPW